MTATAFANFQDAGDVCASCRKYWETQDLSPKELVYLYDAGGDVVTTEDHEIPIVVCPHCDGDVLIRLHK